MPEKHIATYLNDHLAGSVTALDLLENLAGRHSGTPLEPFFRDLYADIVADREELEGVMKRLGVGASQPRRAAAWLASKMAELKLRLDDPSGGPLGLLEAVEAVSLGIEGKRSLWRSLAAVAEDDSAVRGPDYAALEERALEQRRRLEPVRLDAARTALKTGP